MWNYEDAKQALLDNSVNISMPGLDRIRALLEVCGNPQNNLRIIHVVGTNGKGSVSNMLMRILSRGGYSVGMFNSPYISELTEYIHLDGEEISEKDFAYYTEKAFALVKEHNLFLTHFELVTVISILYFCDRMPDICIYEAGMGGGKDATNVFNSSLLTVLTNVSIDHSSFLGNTIEEIKAEKLAIAGPLEPVIMADALSAELEKANITESDVSHIDFNYDGLDIHLNTPALYQVKNAITAIAAVRKLTEVTDISVSVESIIKGLADFSLSARFECICKSPNVFIDGGHNPDCALRLAETLKSLNISGITLVTGIMTDKDYKAVYDALDPFVSEYIAVDNGISRALKTRELAGFLEGYNKPVTAAYHASVAAELIAAKKPEFTLFSGTLYMTDAFRKGIKNSLCVRVSADNYTNAVKRLTSRSFFSKGTGNDELLRLLETFGNPQEELSVIHVAGTNGKGSTCSMIASGLCEAGLNTGLFTSPYLHVFNERIRFNGINIEDGLLAALTDLVSERADSLGIDLNQTAIAFLYYRIKKADAVVLETGLGGTYDPTNIVTKPIVSVITNIGLDHTAVLGNTIEEIADAKAGIIKAGVPVVVYPVTESAMDVIEKRAKLAGSKLIRTDKSLTDKTVTAAEFDCPGSCGLSETNIFSYKGHTYITGLNGDFQQKNAAVAIEALEIAFDYFDVPGGDTRQDMIYRALKKTLWPGRLEKLSDVPPVFCDGGHNPQCIATVCEWINKAYAGYRKYFICGFMKDKDYEEMVRILSASADFLALAPVEGAPRSLSKQELTQVAKSLIIENGVYDNVLAAHKAVRSMLDKKSVVVFIGSIYQLDKVRSIFESDG